MRYPRLSLAAAVSWSLSWSLFWVQLPKLSIFRSYSIFRSSPQWTAAIAAYLDRERPDALLAMTVPSVVAATMAAFMARHRARIVGSLHSKASVRSWLDQARWTYPRVDAAVGVSRGVAAELTEVVGVPADRVHTIYNPVVSEGLVRAAERPAGHPWLDRPGPQVVLAAGRLIEAKDFPTLLAAFAKVLARRPARLIVLGKGPLLPALTAQAEELGGRPARGLSRIRGESVRVHGEGEPVRTLFALRRVGERPDPGDGLRLPGRQHRLPVRSGGKSWRMDDGASSCRSETRRRCRRRCSAPWTARPRAKRFGKGRRLSALTRPSPATRSFCAAGRRGGLLPRPGAVQHGAAQGAPPDDKANVSEAWRGTR